MKNRILSFMLIFSILATLITALPVTSFAATSGTCGDNLEWTLDISTGVLNIVGTGNMTNYSDSEPAPWDSYKEYIKSVNISENITSIGQQAFYGCSALSNIDIGDNVTIIEMEAFYGCTSLESITIPENIKRIEFMAFWDCPKLTEVNYNAINCEYIDSSPFEQFGYCTTLNIGDKVETIPEYAFSRCDLTSVVIPDNVTSVGACAFAGCVSLTNAVISNGLTKIDDSMFINCGRLSNVTIPNSITSIGTAAFAGCDLTEIILPENVISIGEGAFAGCTNIQSIDIPKNVESIGEGCFGEGGWYGEFCENLTSINVDVSNQYYYSENGVLFNKEKNKLHTYPTGKTDTEYIIPDGVKYIENSSFAGNQSLTEVTLPRTVISIGSRSFQDCYGLKDINIPASVKSIGDCAFWDCGQLKSITIPNGVTTIGYRMFYNCSSLKEIHISKSITTIGEDVFLSCDRLTDIYYAGSEQDWGNITIDDWNDELFNATIHYNARADENFEISDNFCIEGETSSILGNINISQTITDIDELTNEILWEIDDTTIAEIENVSYVNAVDNKTALIEIDIKGYKIGKTTITGITNDGRTVTAVISVEPKLNALNYGTIFSPATIEYEISTESDNKEYFEEFVSSLNYDISAVSSVGISVESAEYIISNDGKNAVYIINVTPTLNLTDNTIKLKSLYGQTADIDIRVEKKNGFSIKNDGWSFANSEFSFSGQVMRDGILGDYKNEYIMPLEIYEQVYGSAYINANNITTGELFGGYCQGMSDTAILFYDELLKWYEINNLYEESFNTVNSYYDAINYYKDTAKFNKQYYVTSNPYSEVTRLIECYQLWGNHVGRKSPSSTFLDIFETYCTSNENGDFEYLTYENGGTYVEAVLAKIQQAVIDDTPLLLAMNYQAGGHAIVARTDKMPEDEGNGWWKVFVYNPNKPYINDEILNTISNENSDYELLQKSCNELLNTGDDDYIELNPSKNLWRYKTSLKSGTTEDLVGCDENGEVKIMTKNDGETDNYSIPEFFWVQNPKDYFAGTFENPNRSWLPSENENTITIQLEDGSDFEIYSANRVLLAKAAKGYGISYDDNIYFYPYVNTDSNQGNTTGELIIPKDKYEIQVNSGTLRIWGHDNVVNLTTEAGTYAIVDIEENAVSLTSDDTGYVELLLSNVGSANEYNTYKLSGTLNNGDSITAKLTDDNTLQAESNTKDVVDVYYNSDEQENESYEYTIGEDEKKEPTVSGGGGTTRYTVKFETNGGSTIANKTVTRNAVLAEPEAPTKGGYTFDGWYTDEELTVLYDFESKVAKNFTLYAKWVEAEGESDEWENPFTDVKPDDWYYKDVEDTVKNGLFNGTTTTTFAPNGIITRAMMVTVLYRNEGEPEVTGEITFEDVDANAYYAKAVIWGQQNGIIKGYSETEFAPNQNITREQIAAIMHRYASYKGYDVSVGENTNILSCSDYDSISEYAIASMQYAVGSGLMKGKTTSTLNPLDNATRAEIAAILHRFIEANK